MVSNFIAEVIRFALGLLPSDFTDEHINIKELGI